MKTKVITSLVTFLMVCNAFSQSNLNQYKYVIVPNKFDFLKEENKYRLNELAHFLFEKHNFTALMEGSEYPGDLTFNRCLALRSNIIKESGMFRTKLKIQLKDCNDKIVYTSEAGESREKEFKQAYNIALRAAFNHLEVLNYSYQPKQMASTQPTKVAEVSKTETKEEIQKLKQELKTLKKEKETVKDEEKIVEVSEPKVEVAQKTPKASKPVSTTKQSTVDALYAQAIDGGFQLVDSSPKVVYKIKTTGAENVFLVEGKSAIIYKNGDVWVLEHHTANTKISEQLNIKF